MILEDESPEIFGDVPDLDKLSDDAIVVKLRCADVTRKRRIVDAGSRRKQRKMIHRRYIFDDNFMSSTGKDISCLSDIDAIREGLRLRDFDLFKMPGEKSIYGRDKLLVMISPPKGISEKFDTVVFKWVKDSFDLPVSNCLLRLMPRVDLFKLAIRFEYPDLVFWLSFNKKSFKNIKNVKKVRISRVLSYDKSEEPKVKKSLNDVLEEDVSYTYAFVETPEDRNKRLLKKKCDEDFQEQFTDMEVKYSMPGRGSKKRYLEYIKMTRPDIDLKFYQNAVKHALFGPITSVETMEARMLFDSSFSELINTFRRAANLNKERHNAIKEIIDPVTNLSNDISSLSKEKRLNY